MGAVALCVYVNVTQGGHMATYPTIEKEHSMRIPGPAVSSGSMTGEGPGDMMREGLGGAYAACASSGSTRRGLGSADVTCEGSGPTTRGLGIVVTMCAVHAYGGMIADSAGGAG